MSQATKQAEDLQTAYWGTAFAGQTCGVAAANGPSDPGPGGPMPIGSKLNLNSSDDLSKIIVGNAGAYISSLTYTDTGGLRPGTLTITGAGPKGVYSGDIKVTVLCQSGQTHDVTLSDSTPGSSNKDEFEDKTSIVGVFWGCDKPA